MDTNFDFNLDLKIMWQMAMAIVLGGVIGIEREWLNKSAGFRTMILICMGATIFTICSQTLGLAGDHSRIASNIVVGVGFIGGGVIFKGETGVSGITTAACIWVTAGIGMLIGCMHWEVGCIVTAMVVIVLHLLKHLEAMLDKINCVKRYKLVCPLTVYQTGFVHQLMTKYSLRLKNESHKKESGLMENTLHLQGRLSNHELFINELMNNDGIKTLEF